MQATVSVAELTTVAEIAAEAGVSWWSARGLIRARYEGKLIRLGDRVFLDSATARQVIDELKARRRRGVDQ